MTQTQANLVANEMQSAGFVAKATIGAAVQVSLTNRKVSRIEVETALGQLFSGIEFDCQSATGSIIVTW